MATNDFQPFAYGGAANVVSQSAYLALTTILQNGFSSGVAQSAQLNKVWRQSSIMAAVLAQFSSDYSGQNSTDDGTTATLETNLIAAIRSVTKTGVLLADTGAANAYTASNIPALTSGQLVNGLVQQIVIAHANTGASTYAPDGLTAYPIYGLGLQALQGGELYAGGTAVLMRATIAGINGGSPIWVLMECAGGAQQIAAGSASQHAAQLAQIQSMAANVANDTGIANTLVAALSPAPASLAAIDGAPFAIKIAANNTGATTLNLNGLGVKNVYGLYGVALQGGELVAGGRAFICWSQNVGAFFLLSCQDGALQIAPATQSQHAVQLGQVQSGAARIAGTVVSKSANYTGATTDYDNVIAFTNTGDYTLPTAAAAGIGWKTTIVNASTIAAPKQVRILRSSADTIDADSVATVYVLPGESIEIRADGTSKWWTRGRTPKGRIINVASYSDVGSTTSSTTDANMQAANFSYQPVSPNSLLEIQWSFNGQIANLASTNTIGAFTGYEVTSGNAALGAVYNVSAPSAAGGVGAQAPSIVLVNAISNTVLTARLFALFAKTNNASASVSALVPRCEIREIQNA